MVPKKVKYPWDLASLGLQASGPRAPHRGDARLNDKASRRDATQVPSTRTRQVPFECSHAAGRRINYIPISKSCLFVNISTFIFNYFDIAEVKILTCMHIFCSIPPTVESGMQIFNQLFIFFCYILVLLYVFGPLIKRW